MSWIRAAALLLWLWRTLTMLNTMKMLMLAVFAAVAAAELETDGAGKGAEKKAKATDLTVKALQGLCPDWADPLVPVLTPFLIDAAVLLMNRTGFFASFAAASQS